MAQAGTATVKFVGDYSQMNAGLASALAPAKLKGSGMKAGLAVGGAFAAAFVGSKVVSEISKAVSVTKEFDKELSSLRAVAGASGKQMDALRKQAIKMGADTVFSATEAAKAQTELAKGGLNASQILGGALKSSLDLAAAGELELADAAETVVNSMQLFGLQGKATGRIADMLATAANKTTADVLDFAMALKQGGAVAKTAGYSLNDTVVILEALASAGIKNSDAGTSMKTSLIQLLNPTKKQAELAGELGISWLKQNGELKNGIQISRALRKATLDMTKAERTKTFAILAGTDGFRTLSALYDAGAGKLRNYATANQEVGTAAETAKTKTDNLAGDVEELSGAYETLQITVGTLVTPALREVTQFATDATRKVNGFLNSLDKEVIAGKSWLELADGVFETGKAFAQFPFDPDGGVKRFLNVLSGDSGEVSRIQATIDARLDAASSLRRVSRIAAAARGRAAYATRAERDAEADLRNARKRFGDGSSEVLRAEVRLQRAKRRTIRLTREAKRAEQLQGVERKVVAARTRDQVVQEKSRIVVLNRQVRALGRQWEAERRNNGNSKLSRELEEKIIAKLKQREGTQKRLNNVLADASRQIGPKFAKSLQNISSKAATMESALGRLPSPTRQVRSALGQLPPKLKLTQTGMEDLKEASGGLRRVYSQNMRQLPKPTRLSMQDIQDALSENLEAIQSTGKPQKKRRGGLVNLVRQAFRGGGVPVALSSGEMFKTPDGGTGIVPGMPTAADNVLTSMPVGTKIFTFDGQRRLAEGASESQALRDQAPHFAKGGIVKPEVIGGTKKSAEVANAAISKVHTAASNRLKRAKKAAAAIPQGGNWKGGTGKYPGVSGDTDFMPALGQALSAMSKAAGTSIYVQSGWRSYAEQAALYQAYLNGTGNLAAPPGSSNHESGRAADITPGSEVFGGMAGRFGLGFTVPGESWHIELLRRGGIVGLIQRLMRGGLVLRKMAKGGFVPGIWAGTSIDRIYNKSDGYSGAKLKPYIIKALAEYYGLPGVTMEQITQGESLGRPGVDISDPPGRSRGLYAINDYYNGQYGTDKLRNPIYNTWVASQLAAAAGGPNSNIWHGSSHVTGWNLHYDASADKIRRIARSLGGSGEGAGASPAEQAAAASKSRRASRESLVRSLIGKGQFWRVFDLFARYGDFESGVSRFGGVGPGQSEAYQFLSRVGAAAGSGNPNLRESRLGNVARWLMGAVDLTGAEDGNDGLAARLKKVQEKAQKVAGKRRSRKMDRLARFGEDSPWGKRLNKNASWIELLTERIGNAEREHGAPWSAGGSEYTDAEVAKEVGLNRWKLTAENKRYRMFNAAIPYFEGVAARYQGLIDKVGPRDRWKLPGYRRGLKGANAHVKAARSGLKDLVGLTGNGGTRADTYYRLRELGVTGTVESARNDQVLDLLRGQLALSQQNAAILAGQAPIYQQYLPKYHTGGVVNGVGEQPIMVRGGEGVFTADQMRAMGGPSQVTVVIEDGAVDSDRIRVEVDGVLAQKVSKVRRSVRSFG